MSDYQRCTFRTVQHVPALGLSKRAILMLGCIGVVRMNLDTQIILCINDLNEQRESV